VYVTPGYRMVALDAATGARVVGFGKDGVVDLKLDDDQVLDVDTADIGLHSPPLVVGDVIVVGAAHALGNAPKSRRNAKGYVRGFDARTGKRRWIFHTIPLPGEFGHDTWQNESASYTGNTGVWATMSADPELGLVYLPVELPTGDYYGGHRPGAGLFGESLVALDVKTGQAAGGISSSCTTACGTWTSPAPRSSPTSRWTAGRSRRSPSPASRDGCTCSIA
jgi:quinoprotein glucose dehydrogenase